MTRVRPTDENPSIPGGSKFHSKGIEALVTMAAKLFGAVSRKLERRQSTSSSEDSVESGVAVNVHQPAYTQSSTRKLAFGTAGATEEHKPLDDFYNNSTLTNFSKLFCAIVLLTAFFLVMSRSIQFAYEAQQAAAAAAEKQKAENVNLAEIINNNNITTNGKTGGLPDFSAIFS